MIQTLSVGKHGWKVENTINNKMNANQNVESLDMIF